MTTEARRRLVRESLHRFRPNPIKPNECRYCGRLAPAHRRTHP